MDRDIRRSSYGSPARNGLVPGPRDSSPADEPKGYEQEQTAAYNDRAYNEDLITKAADGETNGSYAAAALDKAIDSLSVAIDYLEQKLKPVCDGSQHSVPAMDRGADDREPRSLIVEYIEQKAERIQALEEHVNRLTRSVDL